MEQKSKNLDPLPESQNKFWEGAEVHTNIVPQPVNNDNNHYFVRIKGHEAQCTHCDWGFVLDPGDKILDGHLYDRSGKLVI
jgi:hypothetical protein